MTKKKPSSGMRRAVSRPKTIKAQSLLPISKKTKALAKSKALDRAAKKSSSKLRQGSKSTEVSSAALLARVEGEITSVIETLNNQMNAALATVSELSRTRADHGRAVVRTAPLDRATATFKRLVAEVVDDQLAEILPPLIAHRNEIAYFEPENGASDLPEDFRHRAVEILDHVLALAGVQGYEARAGETFDPLIHLAVGETHLEDLTDGVVVEQVQPGFRSSRGKVIVPAKIRINRR
jgi:hypothetical protein